MSEIKAINDFRTSDWSFEMNDLNYYYVNLYIGFVDNTPTVVFNNLQFSYELISTGGTITEMYPNPGVVYNQTDETFLTIDTFYLHPSTDYTLNVWSTNNGIVSNGTFEFRTPDVPTPPPTPTPIPTGTTGNTIVISGGTI